METIEKIVKDGCTIDVYQDDMYESPNDWCDDDVFLVGFHDQFSVDRDDIDRNTLRAIACGGKYEDGSEHGRARDLMKRYRVYRLDARIYSSADNAHLQLEEELTGTKRSVDDAYNEYDSFYFGAVFVSRKEARTGTIALKRVAGLLDTWDDYLRGNVYGYTITDPDGVYVGGCGGFYGYPYTDMLDEATAEAAGYAKQRKSQRLDTAQHFIKTGAVYDNGGTSFDRYTIVYDRSAYGMSANPQDPQGYNQYIFEVRKLALENNPAIGDRVMFSSLPEEVQEAIIDRVLEDRDYVHDPDVCSGSLDENDKPSTPGETAHKWSSETEKNDEGIDVIKCDECGAEKN